MLISLYVCMGISEISFSCSFFKAELSQQIKGTVTKSLRYRYLGPVHTKPDCYFLKPHICSTNSRWMNERIHWFSGEGRPFCDAQNVWFQKYPDSCGPGLNVLCYIVNVSNPTCYEFKIHFPLILPSSYFFLLFLSLFLFLLVIIFLFVLSCHGLCFWNCHIRGVVYIS